MVGSLPASDAKPLIKFLALWPSLQRLRLEALTLKSLPAIVRHLRSLKTLTSLEIISFVGTGHRDSIHPLPSICKLQHLTRLSLRCEPASMLANKAAWEGLSTLTSLRSLELCLDGADPGMPALRPVGVAYIAMCMLPHS